MPVRVVELTRAAEHHDLAALFVRVWRADSAADVLPASAMTAIALSGGYVAGAYEDDRLVGGGVGFLGRDHLHSDLVGVDPDAQSKGIGYAVKQHQRQWCAQRGIPEVRWTFDPLVARNAYFNLHRLGARAVAYLPDFYGTLRDGVNAGDRTDRLYVSWSTVDSVDAVTEEGHEPAVALDRVDGEPVVGPIARFDGRSASSRARFDGRSAGSRAEDVVLVAVPTDIEAVRRDDPELARRWRRAVGEVLPAALDAGYRIEGMSKDGFYTLRYVL
jgi:predicted GNAT superfamily acetyltransferase